MNIQDRSIILIISITDGGRASTQPTENYIPPLPPTSEDDIFGEAVPKGENFGKYHQTPVQCIPSGN